MRILNLVAAAGVTLTLAASASAQFSVSGPASLIPASGTGGGGTYPTTLPGTPAISTVTVSAAVVNIDSIVINDIAHTWSGDTQATLADPNGVEHLIWLRPGLSATGGFGSSGDFTGTITMVESGGAALPITGDIAPGTYNQAFDSGNGGVWNSGDAGIVNTPMSAISGPAGTWTLRIYDWASGDSGSFSGWTLNGNGGGGANTGAAYCFGDGSGAVCPCGAFGATGEGCLTTSGTGATLTGSGDANTAADSFQLDVAGAPANKPGIFFQGTNQLNNPVGDGILCSNSNLRYAVNSTDATGAASQSGFGANASAGQALNYQYWFRDPANTCGNGGFNFTNGWAVTWN
jgi:hypothetical protein